jgi:hypothetical protein
VLPAIVDVPSTRNSLPTRCRAAVTVTVSCGTSIVTTAVDGAPPLLLVVSRRTAGPVDLLRGVVSAVAAAYATVVVGLAIFGSEKVTLLPLTCSHRNVVELVDWLPSRVIVVPRIAEAGAGAILASARLPTGTVPPSVSMVIVP